MAFQLFLGAIGDSASSQLTAVAAVGAVADFPGFDKDLALDPVAATGVALDFHPFPSAILGEVAAVGGVGDFTNVPEPTFGPISATGAVRPFAGISEDDPLYAAPPAVTAFGEFTVVVTSPATLSAVQALAGFGEFIVQIVIPPPSPDPGPPLSPVIVSPAHLLNWVWPLTRLGRNAPPITNGLMLEDGTGALLLEDSTPLLLE